MTQGAAVLLAGGTLALVSAHCGSSKNGSGFNGDSDDSSNDDSSGEGGGPTFDPGDGDGGGLPGIDPNADAGTPGLVNGVSTLDGCTGSGVSGIVALQKGGSVDGAMKWLYPYDKTVFPGGLTPPVLQWVPQSGGSDAVYVHIYSKKFDYKGCFPANKASQIPLNVKAWQGAYGASAGGSSDALSVELTTMHGSTVSGPIKQTWFFALGSLKGSVYYNTYNSALTGIANGAVMKLGASTGTTAPLIALTGTSPFGPCISCHSLSADGSTLVAAKHFYPNATKGFVDSRAYNLGANPKPDPDTGTLFAPITNGDFGFAAVYPNGSLIMTNSAPVDSNGAGGSGLFSWIDGDNGAMDGPAASQMFDSKTGQSVNFTGLTSKNASMPMFSPDGKHIVFNDYDKGKGATLAVADFDVASKAFSNQRTIYTAGGGAFAGWPFFTPDSKTVIFVVGDSGKYATIDDPIALSKVMKSNLWAVDVATGKSHTLDMANGLAGGASYLPYPGYDEDKNFYPTGSPVASGGYFWAFFTSRRNYGNTVVTTLPADVKSKKIWVTAISIDGKPGADLSHPAFYLPGQEEASGNIRGFSTLDPCKVNGAKCTDGVDCCGGACTNGVCAKPVGCSNIEDRCTQTSDCCAGKSLECIGNVCVVPVH